MAFYTVFQGDDTLRALRIVYPNARPYRPTEKALKLCELAKRGKLEAHHFVCHSSRLPMKHSDGRVALQFDAAQMVVPSMKNFIIEDQNQQKLLYVYKTADGTCALRIKPQIEPLVGFAIGIACICYGNT
jgi:hypothetical protein